MKILILIGAIFALGAGPVTQSMIDEAAKPREVVKAFPKELLTKRVALGKKAQAVPPSPLAMPAVSEYKIEVAASSSHHNAGMGCAGSRYSVRRASANCSGRLFNVRGRSQARQLSRQASRLARRTGRQLARGCGR